MKPTFQRMLVVLALSGACSLVYQVAWLRLLRLIFGSSTAASAAVVAIFMGGLGLGGWFFGRRAQRVERPLGLYWKLELGIALSAALSPLFVALARWVYLELGGTFTLGLTAATALRLLLAVVVLGVPTTLMGGTLPMAVQALESREDLGRRRTAWLYGLNTLGAVVGALATNFFLLETFGIRQTLWLAAGLNGLLAALVAWMSRRESPNRDSTGREATTEASVTLPGPDLAGRRLILVTAGVVGAAFFLMELVWYRMLASILGGSTYTMGLILALALLGIALGGLAYALDTRRVRPSLDTLAITCAVEALCLSLPLWLGDETALFAERIRDLVALGFGGLVLAWTAVAALVVLPAAVVAGYQFPVLVGLLGAGRKDSGRDVGYAYAWNTAGAILGSLAGGFWLIPWLGAPTVWRLTSWLLILTALLLWLTSRRRPSVPLPGSTAEPAAGSAAFLWLVATGAVLITTFAEGPTAFWRHVPIGAGRAAAIHDANGYEAYRREVRWATRAEADGIESAIALQTLSDPGLIVNGKSDGAAIGDADTTLMSGLIGAALHGNPRNALVIGLGIGTTAGWFTTVDSIDTVDIVELEPKVVELTRPLGPATFHVLDSPKTRLHLGDGRELILSQRRTWDLIFSEPSNPYRAGVADLFSRDFYRAARQRLAPGGIFLQWLQGYEIDNELVRRVFATIRSELDYVETWQVGSGDLLLVASTEPIEHDFGRVESTMAQEAYAAGMRRVWGVEGAAGFYSGFLGGHALADTLAGSMAPSTDDQPRIEFGFARRVGRGRLDPIRDLRTLSRRLETQRPPGIAPRLWQESLEHRRIRIFQGSASDVGLMRSRTARDEAREAASQGDFRTAAEAWQRQDQPPRVFWDRLMMANALADVGSPETETAVADIEAVDAGAAALIRARYFWRTGRVEEARAAMVEGLTALRTDPWIDPVVLRTMLVLAIEIARSRPAVAGEIYEALTVPFAVHLLDQKRLLTAGRILVNLPDFQNRCTAFFEQLEPHVFWLSSILDARYRCWAANADPRADEALNDLRVFISQDAPDFVIREPRQSP